MVEIFFFSTVEKCVSGQLVKSNFVISWFNEVKKWIMV